MIVTLIVAFLAGKVRLLCELCNHHCLKLVHLPRYYMLLYLSINDSNNNNRDTQVNAH